MADVQQPVAEVTMSVEFQKSESKASFESSFFANVMDRSMNEEHTFDHSLTSSQIETISVQDASSTGLQNGFADQAPPASGAEEAPPVEIPIVFEKAPGEEQQTQDVQIPVIIETKPNADHGAQEAPKEEHGNSTSNPATSPNQPTENIEMMSEAVVGHGEVALGEAKMEQPVEVQSKPPDASQNSPQQNGPQVVAEVNPAPTDGPLIQLQNVEHPQAPQPEQPKDQNPAPVQAQPQQQQQAKKPPADSEEEEEEEGEEFVPVKSAAGFKLLGGGAAASAEQQQKEAQPTPPAEAAKEPEISVPPQQPNAPELLVEENKVEVQQNEQPPQSQPESQKVQESQDDSIAQALTEASNVAMGSLVSHGEPPAAEPVPAPQPEAVAPTHPESVAAAKQTGAEPVQPSPEPPQPAPEPVKTAPDLAKAVPEQTMPAPEPPKPSPEQAKPVPEQAKPAPEQAKPVPEPAKPAPEPAKPQPAPEQAKPVPEPAKPAPQPAAQQPKAQVAQEAVAAAPAEPVLVKKPEPVPSVQPEAPPAVHPEAVPPSQAKPQVQDTWQQQQQSAPQEQKKITTSVSHIKTTRETWRSETTTQSQQEPAVSKEPPPSFQPSEWKPERQELIGSPPASKPQYQPAKVAQVWPPPPMDTNIERRHDSPMRREIGTTQWIQQESVSSSNLRAGAPWAREVGQQERGESPQWPSSGEKPAPLKIPQAAELKKQWPPPLEPEVHPQFSYSTEGPRPMPPQQRQWPPPPESEIPVHVEVQEAVVHEPQGQQGQVQRPGGFGSGFKPIGGSPFFDFERPMSPTPMSPGQMRFPERGGTESTQTQQHQSRSMTTKSSTTKTKVTRQWPPTPEAGTPPEGTRAQVVHVPASAQQHSPVFSQAQPIPGGHAHPGPPAPPKPVAQVPQQAQFRPGMPPPISSQQITHQAQQQHNAPVASQIPIYQSAAPKGWSPGGGQGKQEYREVRNFQQGNMQGQTTVAQSSGQHQFTDPSTGGQYVQRFHSQQQSTVMHSMGPGTQPRWPSTQQQ